MTKKAFPRTTLRNLWKLMYTKTFSILKFWDLAIRKHLTFALKKGLTNLTESQILGRISYKHMRKSINNIVIYHSILWKHQFTMIFYLKCQSTLLSLRKIEIVWHYPSICIDNKSAFCNLNKYQKKCHVKISE